MITITTPQVSGEPGELHIDDLDIRVINAATGELYRHLTLDPTRDYQPFPDRDPRTTRKRQQPEPH